MNRRIFDRARLSAPAMLGLGLAAVPALQCDGRRGRRLDVETKSPGSGQGAHFGYARLSRSRGDEAGDEAVSRTRQGRPASPRPNTRPRRTNFLVARSAKVVRLAGRSRHVAEGHSHIDGEDPKHRLEPPMVAPNEHGAKMRRITRGILDAASGCDALVEGYFSFQTCQVAHSDRMTVIGISLVQCPW